MCSAAAGIKDERAAALEEELAKASERVRKLEAEGAAEREDLGDALKLAR